MSTTMTDDHGSTNGAHGGVGHLLRMAKTQCGVSLAFAALRKAEGGFAIATFPSLTADPTWSIEAIDELVRQTWDDPHLGGGTVLVRSGRVLKGMWTGQGHHIKLAAAALSDPEAPDHPWGLLCVAEPVAGHFEQDQLNLLGNLAIRLTSYLRARQQVLEGSFAVEPDAAPLSPPTQSAPPQTAPTQREIPDTSPTAAGGLVGSGTEPLASERAPIADDAPFGTFYEEVDEEHPLDRAPAYEPAVVGWGTTDPAPARQDDWEFLELDEIDWVEAAAPSPVPAEPSANDESTVDTEQPQSWRVPAGPPTDVTPEHRPSTFGTRDEGAAPVPEEPTGVGGLDAMLGPDPITGLATLTTLVGRLSSSLAHVRNNEGTVGLILIEVSPAEDSEPLGPTALLTVAGRLTNHLRDRDLVARIGPSLFAILVDLRPGAIDLEAIRERTVGTLAQGIASGVGGLRARSAMVAAGAGSTASAEELLRLAADQLMGR